MLTLIDICKNMLINENARKKTIELNPEPLSNYVCEI